MKKYKCLPFICALMLLSFGCAQNPIAENNNASQSEIKNSEIDNPTLEGIEKNNSVYNNFVIKDQYKIYHIVAQSINLDIYAAVPNWAPEEDYVIDTADFQNMTDDNMFEITDKRIDILWDKLKPAGALVSRLKKYKVFLGYKSAYVEGYSSEEFINAKYEYDKVKTRLLWMPYIDDDVEQINDFDVGCLTINLYEGFYNNSNSAKVSLYGVTEELFEEYKENEAAGKAHIIDEKDLLNSTEITKSGNYYMDFSEIRAEKQYKNIVIQLEILGDVADEYTFASYYFGYEIDNDSTYREWKSENVNKFIY